MRRGNFIVATPFVGKLMTSSQYWSYHIETPKDNAKRGFPIVRHLLMITEKGVTGNLRF